jgi:2-polyprenyl-3-methyl-5-hydroxy-6-metoxy-1,4-benzoquinol methylase
MPATRRKASFARACPACDGRVYRRLARVRGTTIWQCTGCGLATWDWPPQDAAHFYDGTYWRSDDVGRGYADYFALARATGLTHRRRLDWLRRRGAAAGSASARPRLLDAGAGPGFFVQAARDAGYAAIGLEVSREAVTYAREQLGQDVRAGEIRPVDVPRGPFDVVTLWDVVEHLPAPLAALRALTDQLRPGGLLAVSTGDLSSLLAWLSGARWHLFTLPEHLWFFTPWSLERLLRRAGLVPLGRRYETGWFTLRYLAERVEAMVLRRRVISTRLGGLGALPVPMNLADVMTVVCRRGGAQGE